MLDYDYNDVNGVDLKPHSEFESADETAMWIRAWTGTGDLDGAEYRIFGQDAVSWQLAAFEHTPELGFLVGSVAVRLGREVAAGGERLVACTRARTRR